MTRALRLWFPGAIVHAIVRGNDGEALFRDDDDRRRFLNSLETLAKRHKVSVFAFCLMTNHVHLLLKSSSVPHSRLMQALLTSYASYFNGKYGRRGHLFQDRYLARIVANAHYLLVALRYIHLNPVKAGMVERCEDYPWSSHREYLGMRRSPWIDSNAILMMFGGSVGSARVSLVDFFGQEARDEESASSLDAFPADAKDATEIDAGEEVDTGAQSPEQVFAEARFGVALDEIRAGSRRPVVSRARAAFIIASSQAGIAQAVIARFLACSEAAVSLVLKRKKVKEVKVVKD